MLARSRKERSLYLSKVNREASVYAIEEKASGPIIPEVSARKEKVVMRLKLTASSLTLLLAGLLATVDI